MSLPIGTNNTPEAIREIIQPPPAGEDPNSPMGRLRYYNQSEMILTVSDSGISATSGRFNNFATTIPTNQLAGFVITTNSFWDEREKKTIATNAVLRPVLGSKDVSSVYVVDNRTLAGSQLRAVRLVNGQQLPSLGLTVATARPLYVWGDYNQANAANLGTTNTTTTYPASIVADAITILSDDSA
jgi:hypothetical protein